jgi:hypothetical protein
MLMGIQILNSQLSMFEFDSKPSNTIKMLIKGFLNILNSQLWVPLKMQNGIHMLMGLLRLTIYKFCP